MPLTMPPPLVEHRPPGFPWLGALAPVMASLLLFAVTRSPFALVFAALGPITAFAAMFDGRRQSRRSDRQDRDRRRAAMSALEEEVGRALAQRAAVAEAGLPSTRDLVLLPPPTAPLDAAGSQPVRVGRADADSGIRLAVSEPSDADLAARAAVLRDAPFVVDAAGGVGVVGPPALRAAFAETLRAQLLWRAGGRASIPRVAHAESMGSLPEHCGVLVEIRGADDAIVLRAPDPVALRRFRPELISALERRMLTAAGRGGAAIPSSVDLLDLPAGDRVGLAAAFAVGADGVQTIDLVRDGPHALVGGTTGSGKSELLVAWVLALVRGRTADAVGLLLFDFKGGAAFDPIADLPHVRGLVTDLDGAVVDRATASLGAELRSREARLRAAGARSADEMPELGRLVIVVDEFAALLAERRELHDLFADIAARGRSLGVHLILCTQRPSGVVRDSLAANCALRISLRVVDAADSAALIGDASAARIPRDLPGRCSIALHGELPREAQIAAVSPAGVRSLVAELTRSAAAPLQAGWLPPLPALLRLDHLPGAPRAGGVRLGLGDIPEEASQPLAVWDPRTDGALAVVGAAGSGRSTAARTIATESGAALIRLDDGPGAAAERLWDELDGRGEGPLVIDDADALLDRMEPEHRMACLEALPGVLRRRDRSVALTLSSPATPTTRSLLAACGSRLVLRAASADEHRTLVGSGPAFDPRLPAGGGVWRSARTQVAVVPPDVRAVPLAAPSRVERVRPLGPLLVITTRPDELIPDLVAQGADVIDARETVGGAGPDPASGGVLVIDPIGWQASVALWSLLGRIDIVYDRCSVADYRAVSRDRALPPVLDGGDRIWLAPPGRPVERGRWDREE